MHDLQLRDVLNSRDDLLEEAAGRLLVHLLVLDDVVEEFATRGKLHDQVQLFGRLDDFVELDDVRVLHDFQNVDFTRNTLYIGNVDDLALFEYFDGNLSTEFK